MSTRTLPLPSRLRDQLWAALPGIPHDPGGSVVVIPRTRNGSRSSSAWSADWYEVAVSYVYMSQPLDELEAALAAWPGTVRTTRVTGHPAVIRDEDWPGFSRRHDRHLLRPQVLAMIADPAASTEVRP